MQLITEKNLSKITIYIFIVIMSSMISMITYFYVKNTNVDFQNEMDKFVQEYYTEEKKVLRKEVQTIIDVLTYNIIKDDSSIEDVKADAIRLLNNISFQESKSNYYFVYDLVNIEGGDAFARLVVNPNRPDLLGRLISTNYQDENGKKFREDFLRDIRIKGESYTQYAYKKPGTGEIKQKLSYFKHFEKLNWIIAVGIYIDDIEKDINVKRKNLEKKVQKQVGQNIVLFVMFLSIAILISIVVSQKIDEVLVSYRNRVKSNEQELKDLNETLEKRVALEIEKNREKEQLLIQKAKFISLGEMISNIAHQWRQPLSELSSILMFIKFKKSINSLDDETMNKKLVEADEVLEFMSNTIEGFRNFFMPKKEKEEFNLLQQVNSVIRVVYSSLEDNNIKIDLKINENINLCTFRNEFDQVLLNIFKNSKDVLVDKQKENAFIKVYAKQNENSVVLYIEDNGGGIIVEPIEKIFEPYFSTKEDSDGTGIGLYMSKIIVDKNMKGKLKVLNSKDGAIFKIIIPKL